MRIQLLLFITLLSALIACAPMVKDGQPIAAQTEIVLRAGQTIGQTFTARDRGLNGVEIFLAPELSGTGALRLHLRAGPQSSDDIATATLDLTTVTRAGFYRFAFAPQTDSRGRDYYLLLELSDGAVRVGTASGETYLDGALYRNGTPLDAQMTFWMVYDPIELALGLLAMMLIWLQVIGVAILLFIVPGWALLTWLLPNWNTLSFGERLGLAGGVSIALYPLLILWTAVFDLHLGALYAWAPMVVALGALGWRWWKNSEFRVRSSEFGVHNSLLAIRHLPFAIHDLAFGFVVVLVIFTRFWVIRSLDFPMWGDSYQHTMIAQLIVDNRGLFDSWLPYAELQTFTYHFGFHSAVAAFHWVTGTAMPRAILWVGQILNILAVLALYPLAVRIGGNRWAGVGAVFIAGLLAPMPMFYVNWGRYTQLAGQVILPAVVCLTWAVLEFKSLDWRLIGLVWVTFAGLALTHYIVLIFAALFTVAFFVVKLGKEPVRPVIIKTLWLVGGAGLLFLPWFIHVFAGKLFRIFAYQITAPVGTTWLQQYNAIGDLSAYLPPFLWLLLPLAISWGLWRREKDVILVSLWWFFILLATNPQWFRLPGEGVITNFAVFIAAYIPASVLIGGALGWLANQRRGALLFFLLVISSVLLGARERLGDLHVAQHALITRPDLRATAWIRGNIAPEARFLVNSFFAYGGSLIAGSDGGWWLPLLARRQTTLPPLTYGSEEGPRPHYAEWINHLTAAIQSKRLEHPETLALLNERGVTHVYIGQRQGRVNHYGPVLEPGQLLASPHFRLVYHQDRVWVFEVVR